MKNNPYVGPRPYERGDRHNFYGRNREARELRALIVAEREVLFYAQSGAGKTSLLNAMVIPALEEKRFRVLPVARVGSDLPPGIEAGAVDNVFVFSALLTLAREETPPEALLGHTLLTFLEEYYPKSTNLESSAPLVLIFDQFEELFTTHRDRWQEAEGFFQQVRKALDALPRLGVVFAMREDYVAALDPYVPLFPRRLRARFRMERLGPKGARAAVEKPAQDAGCTFAPDAVERLVDDLRRTRVQHYAGSDEETVAGPFVEPVQLQVVCHQMWENLPEQPDHSIQWEEVEKYGNIDRALTDFYELSLAQAIQKTGAGERRLRRWFDEQLITPMQTRGLAMQGRYETAGLANAAVDVLEKRHLIRADVRAGARWYELTHDRFIEPIQESNKLWNEKRLRSTFTTVGTAIVILAMIFVAIWTVWQRAEARTAVDEAESEMWTSLARNRLRPLRPGLSVSGVNGTAGTLGVFVHDAEGGFYLLSVSDVLGPPGPKQDSLILQPGQTDGGQTPDDVVGYSSLNLPWADGSPMANMVGLARLKKDITFETSIPGIGPIRGMRHDPTPGTPVRMMGRTSGLVTGEVRETDITTTIYSGQESFRFTNGIITSPMSEPGDGGALVVDAEGYAIGIVVAGSPAGGTILAPIQDVLDNLGIQLVFPGQYLFALSEYGPILNAEWLPDGVRIATGGQDGVAHLWNVKNQEMEATLYGHEGAITAIAVDPDGQWMVTGSADATARIWDLTAPDPAAAPVILHDHELGITAVAVSPDAQWLATGSEDTSVRLWDLTTFGKVSAPTVLQGHESGVTTVAISPDMRWLAAGSRTGAILVWNLTNLDTAPIALSLMENAVIDATFRADGPLVTTSADAQVVSWDVNSGEKLDEFFWPIETEQIITVAWSPDETQVVIVSTGGLATVYDAANKESLFALEGYNDVLYAAWSLDGIQIMTTGTDGTIRVWQGR